MASFCSHPFTWITVDAESFLTGESRAMDCSECGATVVVES